MKKIVGGHTRAWMLCTVALLWAWEATADDPETAAVEAAAPAASESFADLSAPWGTPVAPDRIRGGR